MKAKIKNGTISHALLIDSLPDDEAKSDDSIAQDILKASSYLLNMYCKNSDISNKDCVKFMSKYSLPESRLGNKCDKKVSAYKAYRRLLPASYNDGLEKVRNAISSRELPLPRSISSVLFTSGLEDIRRQKEKLKDVTSEGVLDSKMSLSVAQWAQFVEHDLSKTVVRSMGRNEILFPVGRKFITNFFQEMEHRSSVAIWNRFRSSRDICTSRVSR